MLSLLIKTRTFLSWLTHVWPVKCQPPIRNKDDIFRHFSLSDHQSKIQRHSLWWYMTEKHEADCGVKNYWNYEIKQSTVEKKTSRLDEVIFLRPQLTWSSCSFRVNLIIYQWKKFKEANFCIIAAVGIAAVVLQLFLFSVPSWLVFVPG